MAIEIVVSQKRFDLFFWLKFIIGLLLVLLLILSGTYFYFEMKIKELSDKIQEKEKEFIPLEKAIKEEQSRLFVLEDKIKEFGALILNHKNILNVFHFLEKNCFSDVWFSGFEFKSEGDKVIVSGFSNSFTTVEQQALFLRQQPLVKKLEVGEVSIEESKEKGKNFKFSFTITFDPKIFNPEEI